MTLAEYQGGGPALPLGASDITYYSYYGGTEAVFKITEAELLSWAEQNGWSARRISRETVDLYTLSITAQVLDGWVIEQTFGSLDCRLVVHFDPKQNVAYYEYWWY